LLHSLVINHPKNYLSPSHQMDASTELVVEDNNDENDSKADKVSVAEVNNTSTSSEMAENEDKTSEGAANTSSEGEY